MKNDLDFLANVSRTDNVRVLGFGQGSVHGGDSMYWDKDDRRRDGDYDENVAEYDRKESRDKFTEKGHDSVQTKNRRETSQDDPSKGLDLRGTGLYNENGRNELNKYEEEYEASLKNAGQSNEENDSTFRDLRGEDRGDHNELVDTDNEYDDGIDSNDVHVEEYGDSEHDRGGHTAVGISHDYGRELSNVLDAETTDQSIAKDDHEVSEDMTGKSLNTKTVDNIDRSPKHGG